MVVHSYIYYIKFFTESRVTVQILLCFINHGLIYICWLISTVYLNSLILFTCLNIISHVTAMLWFFERLRLHFTVWLQQLPDAALGFSCTPRYAVSEKLKQLSPLPGERYLNWQFLVYKVKLCIHLDSGMTTRFRHSDWCRTNMTELNITNSPWHKYIAFSHN